MTHDSLEAALLECAGADAENQKVSGAAQDRFTFKACTVSSSTTVHEALACLDVSGPTVGFLSPSYSGQSSTFLMITEIPLLLL